MSNIWHELPRPFFVLAPMEAVTDVVFRHVVAAAAPPDLYFTEFTNATGWVHAGDKAIGGRLLKTDDEQPIIAQIWGGEPGDMEALAKRCLELGYDGIDINMGCPAKSAVKSGGSALIRQPELAAASIAAAKTAGLPVSVKTRLGYSSIDEWRDWLSHLLRQDIVNLTIHLRTKKEMSKVPAHHELIPDIIALRDQMAPDTLLTINGDIESRADSMTLIDKYPGVDGVMIGRGVFHDPFCFASEVGGTSFSEDSAFPAGARQDRNQLAPSGSEEKEGGGERAEADRKKQRLINLLRLHLDLYDRYGEQTGRPFETLKRFFKIYIRDFPEASSLRAALMLTSNTDEVRELIDNHLRSEHLLELTEVKVYTGPMSDTIKAIVFDSDGTLLDTRELIFEGYKTVLRNHDLSHLANEQYIRQRLGKPTAETFEQLVAGHKVTLTPAELAGELDKIQNELLHLIKPYPHTLELLTRWKDNGVKLCLFSSGYSYMIDRNFTAAGIPQVRELFDAIVTADDGLPHKPEPNAILEILQRVDTSPSNAVVIGDHAYDIIAAERAHVGLKIGILHGVGTQHELLTSGADFLADNLESLNRLMSFAKR